ncbi:DUF72 domain-containing protein [Alloalcanivorax gelatiniphagus]
MDVRVGLCGWTVAQGSYVRRFPLVEVQHTFYEPPSDALLARWRAQVPAGFEFTMKAWQVVTHESSSPTYRRLRTPLPTSARGQVGSFRTTAPVLAGWRRTLECARVLDATAVLLQCPRSFRPSADNVGRLRTLLSQVERPAGRLLWEPRGPWPTELVADLCTELGLVHVVDPMQGETVTPGQTYYRLHGTTGARHVHTDDELRRLRDLVDGRETPYVLFNNIPRAGDAERFIDLLGR